jgi:hypothetical protein
MQYILEIAIEQSPRCKHNHAEGLAGTNILYLENKTEKALYQRRWCHGVSQLCVWCYAGNKIETNHSPHTTMSWGLAVSFFVF